MEYAELNESIETYIAQIFSDNTDPALVFHNLTHTRTVVSRAKEMGAYYLLPEQALFVITSAAWFHDAGYLAAKSPAGHEQRGAVVARVFLRYKGVPDQIINEIKGCILATQLPQSPVGLLQQIVCDADLYHLGTEELFVRDELMHKEVEIKMGKTIARLDWIRGTINLLESHQYQTIYCRERLSNSKEANISKLRALLAAEQK